MSDIELLGPRRLRELFHKFGIRPTKSLGQNFVVDPNTIRKVIAVARVTKDDHVLEIGAGAGSLTLGLAAAAGRVTAVEFDNRLFPVLTLVLQVADNVGVLQADALHLDFTRFDANKLVGNLPYNIAATIVLRALEQAPGISELTVMTQKEVGARLAAPPGSKIYGKTSALLAVDAVAEVAAQVSRRAFWPVPRVDSVLLRITRKPQTPAVDRARLVTVIGAAFGQRRKTLRNTLAPVAGSPERAEDALRMAGIDPNARAENVGLDGYIAITEALA